MKRILSILFLCLSPLLILADDVRKPAMQIEDNTFFDPTRKEDKIEQYKFGVEYRLEIGYAQNQQRARNISFPDMYLHGARLGATFTFKLPIPYRPSYTADRSW